MKELKSTQTARELVDNIHNEKEIDIHDRSTKLGNYIKEINIPLQMAIISLHASLSTNSGLFGIILLFIFVFKMLPNILLWILQLKLNRISNEMRSFFEFTEKIKPVIGVFPEYTKDVMVAIEKDIIKFKPRERSRDQYKEYWIESFIHLFIVAIGILLFYKFMLSKFIITQLFFILGLGCSAKTLIQTRKIFLA